MILDAQETFDRESVVALVPAATAVATLSAAVGAGGPAVERALVVRHAALASGGSEGIAAHLIVAGGQANAESAEPTRAQWLCAMLDAVGAGESLASDVRAALDDIWRRDPRHSSGVLDALEASGQIIAGAPGSREAERSAALAAALCLARRGIVSAPFLTVWRLDAAARSAAVQLDRSHSWEEWVRAWCALLAREATALSEVLRATAAQVASEQLDVRTRPRTGATDDAVLGWLHSSLRFTIGEAAASLGLTTPTVGTAIERLAAKGYATELTGQLRDRVWVSTSLLGVAMAR